MFNKDFYPTPAEVIMQMVDGINLQGKIILEPSAGKGDIVDYCIGAGAEVFACETNQDLKKILSSKCKVIADDFLTVESHHISHIHCIIMNPPFSADEKHILHAYNIAPPGCQIIALCNKNTIETTFSSFRKELKTIIDSYGHWTNLGDCFSTAERKTNVEVALVNLQKPGADYKTEFEGFFLEDDPEEQQFNGIMPYNFVRDLVNRYVAAMKIYDEQLELAIKMNELTKSHFFANKAELVMSVTRIGAPVKRSEFKKEMQKAGWSFIFEKMNMKKYATQGLKSDINKFVEQQTEVPFTMRNIYKMLEIVIATQEQRMDKAMLEVFDKLTTHYDENRYNVEGWKTNSHYLINEKFIMPYLATAGYNGKIDVRMYNNSNAELIEDFIKALCYLTGKNYDDCITFYQRVRADWQINFNGKRFTREMVGNLSKWEAEYSYGKNAPANFDMEYKAKDVIKELEEKGFKNLELVPPVEWGQWADWDFFTIRCYKKGTTHFKFKDKNLWGTFNQHIARIKGYPLFEPKKKAA